MRWLCQLNGTQWKATFIGHKGGQAWIVGLTGQGKFCGRLISKKTFRTMQQQDFHHKTAKVQPPASEVYFAQPGRVLLLCFVFWEAAKAWIFFLTVCEVFHNQANGAQLCLVLINLAFLSRESRLGRPLTFLTSSSCDGLEKEQIDSDVRCSDLDQTWIFSDGACCVHASECVKKCGKWRAYGGASLGAGDVMSDVWNLVVSEAVWVVRMIYEQHELAFTLWVFVSLQS